MKPFTTLTACLLIVVALAHVLRLIYGWPVTVAGRDVPMWVSVAGSIVPAALAAMIFRERRAT